jgi:hypothetical protein
VKPTAARSAVKEKSKSKPVEVAAAPAEEKKGFIKRLFTRGEKPAADASPELAKAKTAKPSPLRETKAAGAAELAETDGPKQKRGFFSFFRRDPDHAADSSAAAGASPVPDALKVERPDDWAEHRVTSDDSIALYEFGPSQTAPDARLDRGTVVKVKNVRSGWALVEVPGGRTGYIDALTLRNAVRTDFLDPVVPIPAVAAIDPASWLPAPPPPDLPEQPGPAGDIDPALLLLPPLELEPKPNP